jgi:general secretion pathway protein D
MKKYLVARTRISALILAGAFGIFVFSAPKVAQAQGASEKIRLMADTLRARDAGEIEAAKLTAEELIKLAPKDENVQRLLASINAELERRGMGDAVYGKASDLTVEAAFAPVVVVAVEPEKVAESAEKVAESAEKVLAEEQKTAIKAAEGAIDQAEKLAELGAYSEAQALLSSASSTLSLNTKTEDVLEDLADAQIEVILTEAVAIAESGDLYAAEARLADYFSAGGDSSQAYSLAATLDNKISDPYAQDINEISPDYVAQSKIIRDLTARARAQFLAGDYGGASSTFKEVEARDANNAEAKSFQLRIAQILGAIHQQNHYKTRGQMLTEVDQGWERPKVFDVSSGPVGPEETDNTIQRKMNSIVIPQVNFSGMELTRVIESLSELSAEYDPERIGVNIVPLFNASEKNPQVSISLRNLSLDRILQFVTQQVSFSYDVGSDAVTVAPSDSNDGVSTTSTEFFPISRATVIRLTGFRDSGGSSSSVSSDPFATPSASASFGGSSGDDELQALQNFFQRAGVNFEIAGASLAFDGEQLIVTQTRRNLERMRTILRNYNEVKQVEIEAKFLEVSQSDLDEVGFDWTLTKGTSTVFQTGQSRNLNDAFGVGQESAAIRIKAPEVLITSGFTVTGTLEGIDTTVAAPSPQTPGTLDLATEVLAGTFAKGFNLNGAYNLDLAIRALSRKTGSDLMSAPKLTVLSGKRATITVAQELRYPESYGDMESTVSSSNSGGSAISITAGTPQDFVTRNVGVEMTVTPNVENDDTISLLLEPRVTEFEGFVEYGGPSVALAAGTTVTVPAGFFQPVFSIREISTEVTIFDGATVVMGGLTREEVKTISDKVPVLGDIPGLGRLFRSEGETRQKRNLLIFVTANLVSPGGSPARQNYRNVNANSLFQNPTIVTPSGSVSRGIDASVE